MELLESQAGRGQALWLQALPLPFSQAGLCQWWQRGPRSRDTDAGSLRAAGPGRTPQPVMGRDHVVVNLLEESEGAGGTSGQLGVSLGAPRLLRDCLCGGQPISYYRKSCGGS